MESIGLDKTLPLDSCHLGQVLPVSVQILAAHPGFGKRRFDWAILPWLEDLFFYLLRSFFIVFLTPR
jgi:hypothetical protein